MEVQIVFRRRQTYMSYVARCHSAKYMAAFGKLIFCNINLLKTRVDIVNVFKFKVPKILEQCCSLFCHFEYGLHHERVMSSNFWSCFLAKSSVCDLLSKLAASISSASLLRSARSSLVWAMVRSMLLLTTFSTASSSARDMSSEMF